VPVSLTKSRPTVSLAKPGRVSGPLLVNLRWRDGDADGRPIDLDLGCLYELADGTRGSVQALGNWFHSHNSHLVDRPLITLDGDDRSGSSADGETIAIDLANVSLLNRVLVYAFIYEGAPNWAAADAAVTLRHPNAEPVEIRLDESDAGAPMCAIAMLTTSDGQLTVHREVNYIRGWQDAVDQAYGFGLNWQASHK
jgi:tellurite resistance protein TerA